MPPISKESNEPDGQVSRFLPLKPTDFQVLLTLVEQPRHAYAISKAVEKELEGQVRLEIGSLYRMMARLLASGLVEVGAWDDDPQGPRRRRCYVITALGRRVARAEARRLQQVLEAARQLDLLPDIWES